MIYALLMFIGKLLTGLWLVQFSLPSSLSMVKVQLPRIFNAWSDKRDDSIKKSDIEGDSGLVSRSQKRGAAVKSSSSVNLSSYYPAAILGTAMTSRGEIGFLIASLAESKGIYGEPTNRSKSTGTSEIYLAVVWAIVMCTVLGPISTRILAKRIQLVQSKEDTVKGKDGGFLGVWGPELEREGHYR